MQTERLFEIIYLLMERKSMTAGELADWFQVSTRTIYRDVELLSISGIPIYAMKGKGGGISIMDHFILNKSIISEKEQREILSAIQGLQALTPAAEGSALRKLSAIFQKNMDSWIEVDFTHWGNEGSEIYQIIKQGIWERRKVCFDYYNANGEGVNRTICPMKLWFKHRAWYLQGYCLLKEDFRTFKLSRIRRIALLDETFDKDALPRIEPPAPNDDVFTPLVRIELHIKASQAYRVYDEFQDDEIERLPDGSFKVTIHYQEDEWFYGMLLSYGEALKVTSPEHLQEKLLCKIKNMGKLYE